MARILKQGAAEVEKRLILMASRVTKPLAIASVGLIVLYLTYRSVLKLGILSALTGAQTFVIVSAIINDVIYVAITLAVSGIATHVAVLLSKQRSAARGQIYIAGNVLLADGKPVKGAMVQWCS